MHIFKQQSSTKPFKGLASATNFLWNLVKQRHNFLLLKNKKGVALIMALLLITVLVVIVGQLSYAVKVDAFVARNSGSDLQLRYALISSLNCAIGQLQLDAQQDAETKDQFDSLNDEFARPIWTIEKPGEVGHAKVYYKIIDENSKFNLLLLLKKKNNSSNGQTDQENSESSEDADENSDDPNNNEDDKQDNNEDDKQDNKNNSKAKAISPSEQFDRIATILLKDSKLAEPEKLREAIVTWMTTKKGKPDTNAAGPFPTKIPLFSIKELEMAPNVNPMLLRPPPGIFNSSMKDYTTVWSEGKININTADIVVLQSLHPKMNAEIAQSIIKFREQLGSNGKPQTFTNVADLKKIPELPDGDKFVREIEELATVKSSYFTVEATATLNGNTRKMTVVLVRHGQQIHKLFCDFE